VNEGIANEARPARAGGPSSVLVALDGTEAALAAVPVARALARLAGATLHVVHAAERLLPAGELARQLGLDADESWGAIIDETSGDPAAGILRLARATPRPVVVLSVHPDRRTGRLGPTARRVLGRAACPVFLVQARRGVAPWEPRRLLLPHDGSPLVASAFGAAVTLARSAGAALYVLHVASLSRTPPPGTVPVPAYVDQPQHEWPEWSREFLERMGVFMALPPELHPRLFLSRGDPGDEIVRFAAERDIDLVALAWHGTFDDDHAPTVRRVLLDAPCPVLFLRAQEEAGATDVGTMRGPAGAFPAEPRH
jgi:nucleotide-binding universal stress UspA family protein